MTSEKNAWICCPLLDCLTHRGTGGLQGLELIRAETGGTFLEWHGYPGRSYFLQVSDPTSPLESWNFAPLIEVGQGQSISYEVSSTADAAFFRLKFTDFPVPPGTPPKNADPDNDGLANRQELLISNTDPNDPEETPEAEWFVLTGTNAQNVAKARSRNITIPQGESRLVVVFVASEEYREFTEQTSTYNNRITSTPSLQHPRRTGLRECWSARGKRSPTPLWG